MPDGLSTQTVSRSAWLELKEELKIVNDGYEFLDEKAILLAAEMLQQRDAYREARQRFLALSAEASAALLDAAEDQGLDGIQVYPACEQEASELAVTTRSCIGQVMLEASLAIGDKVAESVPIRPGAVVERCRDTFTALMQAATELAAMTANLERLTHEYRRTSRRVRALENVVLPEIRSDLAGMEEHLDLVEQEEVIRVRTTKHRT